MTAVETQQGIGDSIYATLKADVLRSAPDTRLVSERKLASRHAASHSTIRRVMNRLQAEGLIYKVHGGGCFVAERDAAPAGLQTLVYVDTEVGSVSHPFFARRLAGMLDGCEALGFRLQIVRFRAAQGMDEDPHLLYELERQEVAGAIVPWMAFMLLGRLRAANPALRIATTATRYPPAGVAAVYPDYGALGHLAVSHLKQEGRDELTLLYDQEETLAGALSAAATQGSHTSRLSVTPIRAKLQADPAILAEQIVRAGHIDLAADDSQTTHRVMAALSAQAPEFAARCRWISQANVGDDSLPATVTRLETDGYLHGRQLIQTLHQQLEHSSPSPTVTLIGPSLRRPADDR